jgi:hypothetical protein
MSYGPQGNPYESPQAGGPGAASRVSGPAIGLMVTAGLGIVWCLISILLNILGIGFGAAAAQNQEEQMMQFFSGTVGLVFGVIGIIMGIVVLLGAMKMKNLQSYGFSLAATIIAMVPCISPCCLIGLPIGIWSLVVLLDANVKAAFR